MIDIEVVIGAWREGRAAKPGDRNPYYGTGQLARMWRLGYRAMLLDRLNRSPARQAFLAAQKGVTLEEQLRAAADPDWFPGLRG